MASFATTRDEPHGAEIELLDGTRQQVSADVMQALMLAGVIARSAGRPELTADDLLEAVAAVTGSSTGGGPSPSRARASARVTPYRDGPYLVRGSFELTDQDGEPIACSRSTIALCRCGRSQMRPFCDGTHKLVDFRAASEAEGQADGGASA